MTTIDVTKTHVAKELKHDSPIISCRFDPTGKYVFFGAQDFKVCRLGFSRGRVNHVFDTAQIAAGGTDQRQVGSLGNGGTAAVSDHFRGRARAVRVE